MQRAAPVEAAHDELALRPLDGEERLLADGARREQGLERRAHARREDEHVLAHRRARHVRERAADRAFRWYSTRSRLFTRIQHTCMRIATT